MTQYINYVCHELDQCSHISKGSSANISVGLTEFSVMKAAIDWYEFNLSLIVFLSLQ